MRAVIQRVTASSVVVEGNQVGSVSLGYNILLGVMQGDTKAQAELLARKVTSLRVFEDEAGKMNLDILSVGGEILCISQFTLCADIRKGNRPSFIFSAPPEEATELYDYFCECLKTNGVSKVEKGIFGADMKVEIHNDGPVTIIMDTDIWDKK